MDKNNPNNLTQEQIKQGYSTIPGNFDPLTGKLRNSLNTVPTSVANVNPTNTNVITPASLVSQPKIDLPTTPTTTVVPQVQPSPYTEYLKTFDLNQKETQAQNIQNTGLDQYLRDIIGSQGETQAKVEELNKTNYSQLRQDLVNTDNKWKQLEAEKAQDDITLLANMRGEEIKDTLKPFAELGKAQLAGDAQIIRALKTSEQNMLNARSLALQGNIELAKETADNAVALKYAPYKDRIKAYEDVVKAIQPYLTSAEKKEVAKQTFKGNMVLKEIEKAENEEKSIQDLALKIGGFGADSTTIDKVMKAKNMNEALTFAGKYLQNPKDSLDMQLTKAQIAKVWADAKKTDTTTGTLTEQQLKQIDTSPQGKKLVSLSGLYQKSQTYKNLLDTYGFQAVGSEKAKLDQAYADLKIAYKEAANLGALTGPDVSLLEEAIKPASGATNYLNYKLSGGEKGVSGAIEGALNKARAEALQNFKQLTARKPEYRGSEYVTSLITPFAIDYSKADIKNMGAGEIIQTEDGILLESLGNGQFTPL